MLKIFLTYLNRVIMKLNINNEYDRLIKVILAPVDDEYLEQQKQLISILDKYDVEVLMTKKCNDAKYQMFTRDPFIVIGKKILLNYMKESIRQLEIDTIKEVLDKIDDSKKIYLNQDTIIEGGDVIIHNDVIFVGQKGNRTDENGFKFIKGMFKNDYKIIPLSMINPSKYIPFVHLDCLFNPVSSDTAIIYKAGFDEESLNRIKEVFSNLIYVDSKEQDELATNVLSLGNRTVIVQKRHQKLIKSLKDYGFKIEVMDIYDTVKETGYNRCLTCPLERE